MPSDPLILSALDNLEDALRDMGREAGYHRDYAGTQRTVYAWDAEPNRLKPFVLMALATLPPENAAALGGFQRSNTLFTYGEEVQLFAHIAPVERDDGTLDLVRPYCEVRADIHKAVMADRARGIARHCTTHYVGTDPRFYSEGADAIGATVVERYAIVWSHQTGDFSALP